MKISVIVPNYNGYEILKKNLPRLVRVLESNAKYSFELIIVDDGSTDESISFIKKVIEKHEGNAITFKLLSNTENRGFSYTVNRGIRQASGELIVLLNSDVSPKNDFLNASIRHFDDTSVFAVGMMDESVEGDTIVRRGRGLGRWERGFYIHERGEVDRKDTDWVSGGSGIFNGRLLKSLGGFNEIYDPFYWEDIDLCYRAKKQGYQLIFEPRSVVVHYHEKGAILSKFSKKDIATISYRNQFLFVWNNANLTQLLLHVVWLPYHFLKAMLRTDQFFMRGFFWGIKRLITFRKQSNV